MTPEQLEKRLRRAEKNICASKKYKVYTALLTQSGTNPPAATVFENTIGNIVWTRNGVGDYIGTLANSFPSDNTWLSVTVDLINSAVFIGGGNRINDNSVGLLTLDSLFAQADIVGTIFVEIRVYKCEGTTTSTTTTTTEGV